MTLLKTVVTAAGVSLLALTSANAGALRHDEASITYSGEVNVGDAARLRSLAERTGLKTLYLDSPGGAAMEGFQLGYVIGNLGLNVIVAEDSSCFSACAIAFIAGETKTVEGLLGFHVAWSPEDRDTYSAGMKNGQFLGTLTSAYFFNTGYTVQLQFLIAQITDAETFLIVSQEDLESFEMKDNEFTKFRKLPDNWLADRVADPLRLYLLRKGL